MIFAYTLPELLAGKKTQTRRLWQPGWKLVPLADGKPKIVTRNRTAIYRFGEDYAVQPGRGQSSVGRIFILDITKASLCDITEEDAVAEGFEEYALYRPMPGEPHLQEPDGRVTARESFLETWNEIHRRKGARVQDNPVVAVIKFRLLTSAEPA